MDAIADLKLIDGDSPKYERWRRDTTVAITNTFRDKPEYVAEFRNISNISSVFIARERSFEITVDYIKTLDSVAAMLESMIHEIQEYWEDDELPGNVSTIEYPSTKASNQVFVVHGKDSGAKETVARFLTKLKLQPIILHEEPNQGRTIIEKFEDSAQVGFAVVLLTPDDTCCSEEDPDTRQSRARQNVILELGFFLGTLGRARTFPLRKGDVQLPSDYDGVIYTPLDDLGAWKTKLIKELQAAGLDVDANLAI